MALQPSEDLFEDTRMSFGEHLEELRRVLMRAIAGLAIGFLVAMVFASNIIQFLQNPLEDAIRDFNRTQAERRITARVGYVPPEIRPRLDQDQLIPKKLKIEPRELADVLEQYYPEFSADSTYDEFAFSPSQLELAKVPDFANRLADPPEADVVANLLRGLMTEPQVVALRGIAEIAEPTLEERGQLLEVLNALAKSSKIYQSDVFETLIAGADKRSALPDWIESSVAGFQKKDASALQIMKERANETGDENLIRRLNRVLITESFPVSLAPVQIELVDLEVWESTRINTQALKVEESFMVWIKAALIAGIVFSSPWIFYQIWLFVAAGLYPHEKRHIHIYLPISLLLFLSGILLAYFGVFKPVLMFLFAFNASMGIDPQPRIGEWLTFVMILPLGFGIAFQLPLVMLFLNRIGLFEVESYMAKWRLAVLVIFVVAMFLTPADPISMMLLAAPLTILYFGGIGLCRWMPRTRNPFNEAYEP